MRWNVARWRVLASACVGLLSCSHSGVLLVGPDRCEGISERQAAALTRMIEGGEYPEVEEVISAYDAHCREDDALMDR